MLPYNIKENSHYWKRRTPPSAELTPPLKHYHASGEALNVKKNISVKPRTITNRSGLRCRRRDKKAPEIPGLFLLLSVSSAVFTAIGGFAAAVMSLGFFITVTVDGFCSFGTTILLLFLFGFSF